MELLSSFLLPRETLARDCRSVLLFAFRLSAQDDLVFRGLCSPPLTILFSSSCRDLRPASLEKGQETLRLRVYACYAWGGPLLVAGLAALLDHLPSQPQYTFLRPRFGDKQCWFYGKLPFAFIAMKKGTPREILEISLS